MKTAYLAGSMTGTSDGGASLRRQIKGAFIHDNLKIIDPLQLTDDYCKVHHLTLEGILGGLRNSGLYHRQVVTRDLVDQDLECVRNADFVIAYINRPSWGTAGEITYARALGKRVYVLLGEDFTEPPFWILGCTSLYSHSIDSLANMIRIMELF
jgi:hypothetical protein